jgi:hypothetical protein
MKELLNNLWFYGQSFDSSKNRNLWLYSRIDYLNIFRTIDMNPKNYPDNSQGFVPVSNNHPTLVSTLLVNAKKRWQECCQLAEEEEVCMMKKR